MGDETQTSCWNITGWALAGVLVIMGVAFLIGFGEPQMAASVLPSG